MRLFVCFVLVLPFFVAAASAQDLGEARAAKPVPPAAKKVWERFRKEVQRNREDYDKANKKDLGALQKELERLNQPIEVEALVTQFQQDVIEQLDAHAKPPVPPPPDKGVVVFMGHKYKIFLDALTWDDAKKRCTDMGGFLLTIETRDEQFAIHKALLEFRNDNQDFPGNAGVWLGIEPNQANDEWLDRNGVAQTYSNWELTHPKDNRKEAAMVEAHGRWLSCPNNSKNIFICEWDHL